MVLETVFPRTWEQYHLLLLTLAWFAGFGFGTWRGWSWPRSLGLALVAYPFAKLAVGVWLSWGALVSGAGAPALSVAALWSKVFWHSFWYVAVPAFGLLLVFERVPALARGPPRTGILEESGLAPRRGATTDFLAGSSLVLALALAYFIAAAFVASAVGRYVSNGDDSQVFVNVTASIVLVLSIVAGVSEEFLFRGLLQTRLARVMPFAAANVVQAVLFGLVHSGYGNVAHVIGPLLFGLGIGLVAHRLGILAAIVLHAAVDVFALGLSNVTLAVVVLFGGLVALNVYAVLVLRGRPLRWLAGRTAPAQDAP